MGEPAMARLRADLLAAQAQVLRCQTLPKRWCVLRWVLLILTFARVF